MICPWLPKHLSFPPVGMCDMLRDTGAQYHSVLSHSSHMIADDNRSLSKMPRTGARTQTINSFYFLQLA